MRDVSLSDGAVGLMAPPARRLRRALIFPATALALWEASYRLHLLPGYLVGPSAILATLAQMTASGELWIDIASSLMRCYSGFAFGAVAGVMLGLLAGVSRGVNVFFDPLISLTYPVPKVAILPILMVWLGLGDASKIATIALSVFYPVFINSCAGARSVNRLYLWSARNAGATPRRIFFWVVLPAALSSIFAGLRIGLALSFILLFATEMVVGNAGLGYLIIEAEHYQRFDIMFVAILAVGVLGFASDRLLMATRRRLLVGQLQQSG